MGTFGRDTLAVCFLNILSYCPRPPFFKVGSMGATSLGYPTFSALKLFGNLLGPKLPQHMSCFQESCFITEWRAPNLQTVRHVSWQRANDPIGEISLLNRTSWSPIIRIPSRSWGSPAMGNLVSHRNHSGSLGSLGGI